MNSNDRDVTSESPANLRRWLVYLTVFSLVWLLLTEAVLSSWILGIVAVPAAAYLSIVLRSKTQSTSKVETGFDLLGIARFIPYFFMQSLQGGWDVAWRVLKPELPIQPGFIRYETELPPGIARIFFMNIVSLLPGTVSAEIDDDDVIVHALDTRSLKISDLRVCERRVAELLGIDYASSEKKG